MASGGGSITGSTELSANTESQPGQAVGTLVREEQVLEEHQKRVIAPRAKLSVLIFLVGLLSVMGYATAISKNVGLITDRAEQDRRTAPPPPAG